MKTEIYITLATVNEQYKIVPIPQRSEQSDSKWESIVKIIEQTFVDNSELKFQLYFPAGKKFDCPFKKQAYILCCPMEVFSKREFYLSFIHSGFREITDRKAGLVIDNSMFFPIITVGLEDIMPLYEEDFTKKKNRNHLYDLHLVPTYKFLDASIWHRYVPLNEGFVENLTSALLRFQKSYNQGLYFTFATRANLEFQTRIMQQSFIANVGGPGHHDAVTPFKFHSETQMKERLTQLNFFKGKWEGDLRWKFLLVDDQANSNISSIGEICQLKKRDIIQGLVEEEYSFNNNLKVKIEIEPPLNPLISGSENKDVIKQCLKKLEEETYDIILLDYLLGASSQKTGREYGHEFITELLSDSQKTSPKYRKGPFGRHWISPISSFPFALNDKLNQLGINNFNHIWHLSNGGDPISTPELFRYNIFRFMQQQISECFLYPKAMENFLSQFQSILNESLWIRAVQNQLNLIKIRFELLVNNTGGQSTSTFAISLIDFIDEQVKYKGLKKIVDNLYPLKT